MIRYPNEEGLMRWLFVFLAGAGLFAASASADLYSWTDRNGVRHVSIYPPPRSEAAGEIRVMKTTTAAEDTGEVGKKPASDGGQEVPSVEIYVDGKSEACMMALAFLTANNIPFTKYDMDASPEARERFNSLEGKVVPLILIGDQRMDGWNEEEAKKHLGLK
jgi:hypothetical protein